MNYKLGITLISVVLLLSGCGNKNDKSSDEQNKEPLENFLEDKISITPDNIDEITREFEIDFYPTAKKFENQEVYFIVSIPSNSDASAIREARIFTYQNKEGFLKMPSIHELNKLYVFFDWKNLKPIPENLQGTVKLVKGTQEIGYEDIPEADFNNYYLIYDKKKDYILSEAESRGVSIYLAVTNSKNFQQTHLDKLMEEDSFRWPKDILNSLKNGDLYYYDAGKGRPKSSGSSDIFSPAQVATSYEYEPTLLPCQHLVKGTVSFPIDIKKNRLGNYFYTVNVKNAEIVKSECFINKSEIFSKQVVWKNTGNQKKADISVKNTDSINTEILQYQVEDPDGFSNLRSAPNGDIIQKVYEGETFEVIGESGKFKKVKLTDGTEGYIHASRVVLRK
jgi:hypothetical protein